MATVEVTFTPLPAHVRTARLVATAVARRSGVDEALLDEVRLAVGEACSRAVEAHRRHCPAVPVRVELTDLGERFEVVVSDAAPPVSTNGTPPSQPAPSAEGFPGPLDASNGAFPAGLGLAVISGLADDVRISSTDKGVSVRMSWPAAARRLPSAAIPSATAVPVGAFAAPLSAASAVRRPGLPSPGAPVSVIPGSPGSCWGVKPRSVRDKYFGLIYVTIS
jgi:anti-sigma regulatory factor (Ser/Thr protein kinase)